MESKKERQDSLLELIKKKPLFSQLDICEAMVANGFQVTQPSISRDIKELGIVKLSGRYLPPTTLSEHIPESLTLSVLSAGPHLVVIRTKIGSAQAVAVKIDDLEIQGCAGCVAGDDTIFVALTDKADQKNVVSTLESNLI